MQKKLTIRDVAKHAGVSHATVSYVLNGVSKVSEETKKKVMKAIDELNYHPDFTAVSLSKSKSSLIGVMVPLIEDSPAAMFQKNQYYHEFISGVEMVARQNKYDTLITGVGDPIECRNWVKKRKLDGLIFLGLFPESLHQEMKKMDIPIVLIDTYEAYTNQFNNVHINDEYGGYLAAKHMVELGHREIAFVATNLNASPVDQRRFDGYKKALDEKNIAWKDSLLFESYEITYENGVKTGEAIVQSGHAITGIVTVSDILAIGIMKALQKNNKKVPDDFSIVGFDDLTISQFMSPSLTTVKQDIFNKGKMATDLLVQSIGNENRQTQTIELPVTLVRRDSTKAL
ncbi:MAG: LacI family DNA-binding transcriptional regulator [Bacillota bacterium]